MLIGELIAAVVDAQCCMPPCLTLRGRRTVKNPHDSALSVCESSFSSQISPGCVSVFGCLPFFLPLCVDSEVKFRAANLSKEYAEGLSIARHTQLGLVGRQQLRIKLG